MVAVQTPADGFVPLFSGSGLTGWEYVRDPIGWSAKDGVVACSGEGRGWLRTVRMYRDFVLRLEYAIGEGGNSGIFLRSLLEGRPAYNGMEMQILDDHGTPPTVSSTGAIYDAVAPTSNPARPAGEWNDVEITCARTRVAIVLNGERIIDVDLSADEALRGRPREGYIGLQNHHSPVRFRNVSIKEL
jgi:hypothetical protein